ncbi:MAG: SEC-C metal-binding domain-containing protein [Actinobacteria bacterium]|nr:SEC-C metal-binding domain-containing protein [Actinomycetota bacterium]
MAINRPGRNDPCPCGSGKKYKKCCEQASELADYTWRKLRQVEGELTHVLMEFAERRYGRHSIKDAWDEYTFWQDVPVDPESEPELDSSFVPWFLFRWEPDNADREEGERYPDGPAALLFLKEHPEQAEPFQRRFIEAICSEPYSFFMVTGVEPGRHLMLKDLLLGRVLCVLERTSSQTLAKGQILFTRVVTLDGVSIMVGCAPVPIPAHFFNNLLDFRETVRARLAEIDLEKHGITGERFESLMDKMLAEAMLDRDLELREMYYMFRDKIIDSSFPQLRNTDGEEMQPVELHYLLTSSPRESFDALKSLALGECDDDLLMDAGFDEVGELTAVRFPWLRKGNRTHESWDNTILGMLDIKGEKLVIEVNSSERAESVRRKITRRLGRRATLKNTVYLSPEAILAEAASKPHKPEPAGEEDLMAMPEVQAKMREMTAHHWATWPDIPLPALAGQTPREAAKTPLGRERLEALLLDFEGRAASSADPFGPDLPALRRELGLGD